MPRRERRKGRLDDVINRLGLLPQPTSVNVVAVVFTAFNMYCNGELVTRRDNITIRMLFLAGFTSWSPSGKTPSRPPTPLSANTDVWAAAPDLPTFRRNTWTLYEMLEAFQERGEPLTSDVLRRIQTFVLWGLEVYGFTGPAPVARNRPFRGLGLEEVREEIARNYRKYEAGEVSLKELIRGRVRQNIFRRERMHAVDRKLDPEAIKMPENDDPELILRAQRLEAAYYRGRPEGAPQHMPEHERRKYRDYVACHFKLARGLRNGRLLCADTPEDHRITESPGAAESSQPVESGYGDTPSDDPTPEDGV